MKAHYERKGALFVSLVLLALFVLVLREGASYDHGTNWRNVSVDTTLNVTDSPPTITSIALEDASGITLNAGSTTVINCNLTVRDYNGAATIEGVNATYYDAKFNASDDPDNNNTHYSNASCREVNVNGYFANYTCAFTVYYYANNGSQWTCNATAIDDYNFTDTETNTSTINQVYALNVTSPIDYGNISVGDTSNNRTANVTNIGNVPMNVTVFGFGNSSGDQQAMVCNFGNISVAYEKWSIDSADDYAAKTALTGNPLAPQQMALRIEKQTQPAELMRNTTYWQIQVPAKPIFGRCNGTIVFSAEDPNPI